MTNVPFSMWYNDVLEIIEFIKKSDFNTLKLVESYSFNNLSIKSKAIENTNDIVYEFCLNKNVPLSNSASAVSTPSPTVQAAVGAVTIVGTIGGSSIGTLPYSSTVLSSWKYENTKNIENYIVSLMTDEHKILKIEITVFFTGGLTIANNYEVTHSILFGKSNILVDGEWYDIETEEPFLHDINTSDISILNLIEIMKNFN